MGKRRFQTSATAAPSFKKKKNAAPAKGGKKGQQQEQPQKSEIADSAWKTVLSTPRDESNDECSLEFGVKVVVGSEAITAPAISFVLYVTKGEDTYELRLRRNEAKWLAHALLHPDGVQTFYKVPMRQLEARFMDDQDLLRIQMTDDWKNVFKIYCCISVASHISKKLNEVLGVTEFDWKSYYDRDIYLTAASIKRENASFSGIDLEEIGSILGLVSPQYIPSFGNLEHEADKMAEWEMNAPGSVTVIRPKMETLLSLMLESSE